MKKRKALLAVMLTLSLLLASCGDGGQSGNRSAPGSADSSSNTGGEGGSSPAASTEGIREIDETYLTMMVGASGGGWYIMGAGLNDGLEELIPGLKMTLVPGGGNSNPTVVDAGTSAQIGFTYVTNAIEARSGAGEYDTPHDNMYALVNLSIKQYLHMNVTPDCGITSLEQLAAEQSGLKFAVGPRGGGNELAFSRVLAEYGVDYGDIISWGGDIQYISTSEGTTAIKDGQIDGTVYIAAVPLPAITETLASRSLNWLSIGEEQGKAVAEKYGYSYIKLPANVYPDQNEEIPTIADTVVLVISGDVHDDVVYNIAKVIHENKERWESVYSTFEEFVPDLAADAGIPLHPGAEEYYREVGLL